MMHFPPSFQIFPLFSKNFQTLENFTYSRKFSRFSSAKISDDLFLVIGHKFRISPSIFLGSVHFPPVHENCYFRSTLKNFPPVLEKFTCFLHTLCVFRFPPSLTMMHLCIIQCTYWTTLFTTSQSRLSE